MPPDGFTRKVTLAVRFRDLDMMGHVNNAVYFTYLEQARLDYFRDLSLAEPLADAPMFILASARVDYRAPLFLDERIDVWLRTTEIGTSSLKTVYEIRAEARGVLAASAETVMVRYDYGRGAKLPISDALREALERFEGRPIARKVVSA